MRDKLAKLLEDSPYLSTLYNEKEEYLNAADHLLANGIILPPVKLGSRQKIYIPVGGTTVVYETKVYGVGIDEDGDMVINPKEYPEEVIQISCFNIGKTVFLTKEEAEKALEERSKT